MHKKILADECVDFRIIKKLEKEGFDVISVLREYRSISDKKVLELAKKYNAILLTEDSDFGEWVFSYRVKDISVIFLRYNSNDIHKISTALIHVLNDYKDKLFNKFVVIKTDKIRIRAI